MIKTVQEGWKEKDEVDWTVFNLKSNNDEKLIEWLGMSNRWKHLIGGLIIGILHLVGLQQCMPEF